ncbi:MAG TPA: serine hydrolase domain-containing protein [Allosphingosinicella sp.]|jgi:CubicO group peptidase (beta-lactamase class C family)|nr:serine hydrolase domain-containing protein [Allosphingosinicella sp.]
MDLADPQSLGFDPERLACLDRYIAEKYLQPGLLPHAQLLVARDGIPVHFSTQGTARAGSEAPLREDAIFRIASMTKPVTSVAFMMLMEEGKVALDTPVADVIPELAEIGVYESGGGDSPFRTKPPERPMLMLDLLRHTSGLTYDFQRRTPVDAAYRAQKLDLLRPSFTLDQLAQSLGKLPLEFSPGEAWNYSVSTDMIGLAVERVSGMPFASFLESRIFAPLGMADTGFHVPPEKRDRFTDAWVLDPKKGRLLYDAAEDSLWGKPPVLAGGGGGLASTTADYHRFCRMLLSGGTLDGTRLLGRKTLDLMTRNHLPGGADLQTLSRSLFSEAIYAGQGFGLGFAVNLDPAKSMVPGSAGEFYWGGIFSTYFFIDPVERVSMIFMTQLMPSSSYPIRRQLKTMVYAALA